VTLDPAFSKMWLNAARKFCINIYVVTEGITMKSHTNSRKTRMMSVGLATVALVCSTIMIGTSAGSATVHKHKAKAPIVTKAAAPVATATTPIVLTSPTLPGVAPLPGPVAPASTPSTSISALSVTPSSGFIGTPMTIAGAGLPANTSVQIQWATANATWVVGADPSTVNYLGANYTKINVILDTVTTSATGAFSVSIDTPKDFGGQHSIYAVVGTTELSEAVSRPFARLPSHQRADRWHAHHDHLHGTR